MNVEFNRTNIIESNRLVTSPDKKHEQRVKIGGLEIAAYIENAGSLKTAIATKIGRWEQIGVNKQGKPIFVSVDSIAKQSGLTHAEVKQAIKNGGESELSFQIYTKLFNAFKKNSTDHENINRVFNAGMHDEHFFSHVKGLETDRSSTTYRNLSEINDMVNAYKTNQLTAFKKFFNTTQVHVLETLLEKTSLNTKLEFLNTGSAENILKLFSKKPGMLHSLLKNESKEEQVAILGKIFLKVANEPTREFKTQLSKILKDNPEEAKLLPQVFEDASKETKRCVTLTKLLGDNEDAIGLMSHISHQTKLNMVSKLGVQDLLNFLKEKTGPNHSTKVYDAFIMGNNSETRDVLALASAIEIKCRNNGKANPTLQSLQSGSKLEKLLEKNPGWEKHFHEESGKEFLVKAPGRNGVKEKEETKEHLPMDKDSVANRAKVGRHEAYARTQTEMKAHRGALNAYMEKSGSSQGEDLKAKRNERADTARVTQTGIFKIVDSLAEELSKGRINHVSLWSSPEANIQDLKELAKELKGLKFTNMKLRQVETLVRKLEAFISENTNVIRRNDKSAAVKDLGHVQDVILNILEQIEEAKATKLA